MGQGNTSSGAVSWAPDTRFYSTAAEAARRLHVSQQRVVHLAQAGHLPSVQTARGWLIDPDAVAGAATRHRDAA